MLVVFDADMVCKPGFFRHVSADLLLPFDNRVTVRLRCMLSLNKESKACCSMAAFLLSASATGSPAVHIS
jgi:hypothetical protein